MNNIPNIAAQFMQFMNNPMGFMGNAGIPQQYAKDPNSIIKYLMDNGRISQQQYNQASNMARNLQNNPQFRNLFKR